MIYSSRDDSSLTAPIDPDQIYRPPIYSASLHQVVNLPKDKSNGQDQSPGTQAPHANSRQDTDGQSSFHEDAPTLAVAQSIQL